MSIGALVDGRFRLEALAGSGGMGEVYRARDTATGDVVALKLLHPHAFNEATRLAREAQALAALRHPNVVRYVAHGTLETGLPYLAMEWLEGEDLHARLDRGPLSIADAVALGTTVAGALHAAHLLGLVHRDIKPSNLLMCGTDPRAVKVLDFGIVRWHSRVITATGMAFGTPGYMAPEQARSAGSVDARADVFSLGCVLFEAVSGTPVFTGESVMAVLAKVMLEPAPVLSDVLPGAPAALEELLARMLDKDPDARPPDAGAVAAELAALQLEPSPVSAAPSRRRRAVTEAERRIVSLVLARSSASLATNVESGAAPSLDALRAAVWPHGERVEMLVDGSVLVLPVTTGSARDQANQAARCALALRAHLPRWSISVGSGRAESKLTGSLGEAIDRASRSHGAPDAIHVDDVTSAFLDPRFEVRHEAGGAHVLVAEHAQADRVRSVLGKPTPCVGREGDLGTLIRYLDECVSESRARPILVTGPAGIGKSRLRAELLRHVRARVPAVEIWTAHADPVNAGSPFAMIASAIRRAAALEGAPKEVARQRLRALVARHVPESQRATVVEFLGELVDVPSEDEGSLQLRAARRDPALMGDQMARALTDLLGAETTAHPLLLVLEDLHWGDVPSVKAIDVVLRTLRDRPLMVLALARPEVHDFFPRLWSGRGLAVVPLSELSGAAASELVRAVLGDSIPDAAARRLVERSAGNPFFLEELIRVAARGDADAPLPDTVLGVIEGRLEELSPQARRTLRAASVFGLVFWSGAVRALLGTAVSGADPLDELLERELIQQRRESRFVNQIEYAFHHALIREAAHSMLTDDDKVVGHKLAAEWLESAGEHDSALLAAHFEAGRELDRAAAAFERAAVHALEGNDLDAVIARVERGIACGAAGELLGRLLLLKGQALAWQGNMAEAARVLELALAELPEQTRPWYEALGLGASTANASGNPGRAEEAALLLEHDAADSVLPAWVRACSMVATCLLMADRFAAATALVARLERIDEVALEPASIGESAAARALYAMQLDETSACAELQKQAIEAFEAVGHVRRAALQRATLANTYFALGDFAATEAVSREVIATAERLALTYLELGGNYQCGRALTRLGKHDEARAMLDRAATGFASGGNVRFAGAARVWLADVCLASNDLDGADAQVAEAIDHLENNPPFLALAFATRALVRLRQGRAAEALSDAQDAVAPLELGQRVVEGASRVRLVHAEALRATGATERSCVEIAKARDEVQARAAKIAEARWRRSFLEDVAENARTLELARIWLAEKPSADG